MLCVLSYLKRCFTCVFFKDLAEVGGTEIQHFTNLLHRQIGSDQ